MSVQSRIHQLSDLLEASVDVDWRKEWLYLLLGVICTIITGPLLLFGFMIRQWNDTDIPWDAEDHWVGTRQFAVTFVVADVLLVIAYIYFRAQLVSLTLILWYLGWTLLSPTVALLVERVDPRRITAKRVRLPSEQPPPPPPPPTTVLVEEQPAAPTRPKRPTTSRRSSSPPKTKQQDAPSILGVRLFQGARKETPIQFSQASLLAHDDGGTFTASSLPEEAAPVEPTIPSSEPKSPSTKRERRNPESLDSLF